MVPRRRRRARQLHGFTRQYENLGGALAPTVTGYIVQATGSFERTLLAGAAAAVLGALPYVLAVRHDSITSNEGPDEGKQQSLELRFFSD